ncbi:ATP-binding protein [Thiomonas bhubaneswarensis]|uniref:histidine kinase n=1 Tax=Thiomonas bhubaneswarensis TaxID=339866 RepID=A0A0K6HZC2_9BURK|nr:ATP-binding protein [Thiomonas bhubaneswarensis]CUA96166.1 Signal transduction histidine kinase [Thiomonas bhubaneswarensis]
MKPIAALRHWAAQSLLRRLWLWMTVSVVVVGLGTTALSYFFAYQEANELQDAQLRQIASLVHRWGGLPTVALDPAGADVDPDARVVVQKLGAPIGAHGLQLPAGLQDGMHVVESGGHAWRVFVREGAQGRIAVAQRTDLRTDAAIDSAQRTLFPLLALIPLLALLSAWVVKRALRPLRNMSQSVDARSEAELHPLPEQDVPKEVLPFVRSINRLLGRLAAAMEQQRRFVADAAHELRTPIAVLSMQVDNLKPLQLDPQARERIGALQQGLRRARAVVEQLLSLARSQGEQALQRQRIDPAQVVREVITDLLPLAESRGIDLGIDHADAVQMLTDPAQLYTLLRNATDNALRYTPPGARVDLRVIRSADSVVIEVQDSGPGIPPDQLERVFEPFVRLPGAEGEGSGLGLSIIRQIAQRLGGSVSLANAPEGGLILRYTQTLNAARSG